MADRGVTPRRHPARVRVLVGMVGMVGTAAASLARVDGEAAGTRARRRPVAAATAVALGGVGALHIAWGSGSTWPCANERSLVRHVVGTVDGSRPPGPVACHAVATALAVTAVAALGRQSERRAVRRAAHVLTRGAASVLALRGVAGAAQSALAPATVTAEYRRLDLRAYSPVCVALAAALIGLGGAPGWVRRRGR